MFYASVVKLTVPGLHGYHPVCEGLFIWQYKIQDKNLLRQAVTEVYIFVFSLTMSIYT